MKEEEEIKISCDGEERKGMSSLSIELGRLYLKLKDKGEKDERRI